MSYRAEAIAAPAAATPATPPMIERGSILCDDKGSAKQIYGREIDEVDQVDEMVEMQMYLERARLCRSLPCDQPDHTADFWKSDQSFQYPQPQHLSDSMVMVMPIK